GSRPHNVAAVKLYVSSDRGATWQEISTAKPEVEYFRYHAPHDGEFWFAIRTIDRLGRARPEGPMRPEQRMLIDTTNPEIVRFDAWYSTPGKITASWQAVDTQIDLQHTTIEYRLPSGDWQLAPTAGGYIER